MWCNASGQRMTSLVVFQVIEKLIIWTGQGKKKNAVRKWRIGREEGTVTDVCVWGGGGGCYVYPRRSLCSLFLYIHYLLTFTIYLFISLFNSKSDRRIDIKIPLYRLWSLCHWKINCVCYWMQSCACHQKRKLRLQNSPWVVLDYPDSHNHHPRQTSPAITATRILTPSGRLRTHFLPFLHIFPPLPLNR